MDSDDNGSNILLPYKWVFWSHNIKSNDWSIKGYNKLYTIETVAEFWKVMNNLDIFGPSLMHFYLMKEGIEPTWEDPNNRFCGLCSLKLDFNQTCYAMEQFCSYLVSDNLLKGKTSEHINGISISPKINSRNSCSIIKIWNKDNKTDISKILNSELHEKFKNAPVLYKLTNPEN